MKIMQIASGLDVSGATNHCLLLARELSARGHEIAFVCRPNSWLREQVIAEGYDLITSDMHRWPADELRRVCHWAQNRGVDLIHTHMSRAHFFGVLLRWMSGIPCVATAHSCRVQFHWMFNDLVIAVSDKTRRFHESYNLVRPHRIKTIHNFIDDRNIHRLPENERQDVRKSFGLAKDDFVIGVVGTVGPRKGQLHLVHALPQLLQEAPNSKLLLIGDPIVPEYVARTKADAGKLGVDDRIVWAGRRGDISRIISAFDVSVLPSLEENFPLVILEAMAASVPVVATDVGGVAEGIIPGETGLLVPPSNPPALAQAIASLASSPEKRAKMGKEGRNHLLRFFSTRSQTHEIEKALSSVAAQRHPVTRAA